MPVELRKRKPREEPAPAPARKKSNPVKKAVETVKEAVTTKTGDSAGLASPSGPPAVGSKINLPDFGGEVQTHDGKKTTLAQLVEQSKGGVVLFTYPKASTPGCTKQACMFRDEFKDLTSTGFAIYGLSRDSPNANTSFHTKQNLSYTLLCDPDAKLIGAIGMKKAPSGTTRGVFVVDKAGKVLAAEPGSPDGTVAVVKRLVGTPAKEDTTPMTGVTHTGPAAKPPKSPKPPTKQPAASTIEKKPLAVTPAEGAAKKAQASPGLPAPKGAASTQAQDAAIAKVADDVMNSAAKADPATPNPA